MDTDRRLDWSLDKAQGIEKVKSLTNTPSRTSDTSINRSSTDDIIVYNTIIL